jgi:DnaK suppressor protein
MARRDALLRLHKTLLARSNSLRKALAGELADLRNNGSENGDSADVAFDAGSEEISTQLAELEARELTQIEKAISRIKQGTYGLCEICQTKIPVARLNALPYSTTCVNCQREMELYPGWEGSGAGKDWEKVFEARSATGEEREVNLSDIEMDISSSR